MLQTPLAMTELQYSHCLWLFVDLPPASWRATCHDAVLERIEARQAVVDELGAASAIDGYSNRVKACDLDFCTGRPFRLDKVEKNTGIHGC